MKKILNKITKKFKEVMNMTPEEEIKKIEKELMTDDEFIKNLEEGKQEVVTNQPELPNMPEKTGLGKQIDKIVEIKKDLSIIKKVLKKEMNLLYEMLEKEQRTYIAVEHFEVNIEHSKPKIKFKRRKNNGKKT